MIDFNQLLRQLLEISGVTEDLDGKVATLTSLFQQDLALQLIKSLDSQQAADVLSTWLKPDLSPDQIMEVTRRNISQDHFVKVYSDTQRIFIEKVLAEMMPVPSGEQRIHIEKLLTTL